MQAGTRAALGRLPVLMSVLLTVGVMACSSNEAASSGTSPADSPALSQPAAAADRSETDSPSDTDTDAAAPAATTAPRSLSVQTTQPPDSTAPAQADDRMATEDRDPGLEGRWEGVTVVPGLGELPFSIELFAAGALSGTMDIQGNFGLPLSGVVYDAGRLRFELESPLGLATWDGLLSEGRIEGEFAQLGNSGTFWLQRPGAEPPASDADNRASSYRSEQITISSGGFVLSGEITLPDGDGPHPAAVLINGSGDQDRDATMASFPMFAHLAEHLAGLGVASLRYDDRGVGGSTGAGLLTTLANRADDVEAAVALLRSRPDVDADRVGLIGHSEGGFIAPIVANRTDGIDFVVLLAAPAVPGDELLRSQLPQILKVSGASQETIEREQALQQLVLEAIATGEGWDEAEAGLRSWARELLVSMTDEERDSIPDEDVFVDIVVADKMAEAQSPWFRSVVEYDPRPDIVALDIPLLALFAELDPLVPLDLNAAALVDAIASSAIPSHELGTIAGANHLFQEAVTGSPDEYGDLAPAFIPEFLQFLTDWLTEHLGP